MNSYCHLTLNEREIIFLLHEQGKSLGYISKQLNRAKSTISRELKRNTIQEKSYSPSKAQEKD
ncbi:IS30 family transposase [Aerococcus sp. 150760007-1]|uniref:Helix-turn-helix domain-containing protein n=1 Tax=Aerococcus urinaeequi TaxID=51665 RepID=A0ABR5ZYZ1_9LACT|nr:helix-turn-helix domain-containing protein [Aerococcus urinaeequi]MBA5746962.1 helix-turn-helix domain-containing protein [Aerococcus urinaeequi]MBA5829746.1 helix-turn-helix domain-containing protein [Aerococcus urinaeequi]MBA5860780.1 helix-turn-helix domain-containing protein [Aerococcus urinaeequi]